MPNRHLLEEHQHRHLRDLRAFNNLELIGKHVDAPCGPRHEEIFVSSRVAGLGHRS